MFATYENLLGCDSADFDAATDYLTTGAGLTGAADGKKGTFCCWLRIDGGDGTDRTIFEGVTTVGGTTPGFRVRAQLANTLGILGVNSALSTILFLQSTSTYTASATWIQLLASWDLGTPGAAHLYVSDVDELITTTFTDDNINYTLADWAIGGGANGGNLFDGCLAEIYFAPEYIDLSVATNRAKFISTTDKPVSLGLDAAFPTGTAAIVYQHLDNGEAVASFATNAGTGGDFAITGTLATGSTSPSD